jgi:hypothetical protein
MYRTTLLALLLFPLAALAQEIDFREELRFVEALRARGDNDLAVELIQKLRKIAPPALARELPLEEAKTQLRRASEEAETARRLRQYRDARANFQQFIDANPGHPRIAEANLDIARVLHLAGKTELNQALLSDDAKTRGELAQQARATLIAAAARLKAAAVALEAEIAKLPDPESISDAKMKKEALAVRNRLESELKQTQIERGLNLYDQAATFLGGSGDEAASKLLVEGKKLLDEPAGGPPTDPATWKAQAWRGRIIHQIESAQKARDAFKPIIDAGDTPVTTEGVRLARYFRLLVIKEQPTQDEAKQPGGANGIILEAADRWRRLYPKFLKTSEGFGITFLLAETLIAEAERNKVLANDFRKRALALLRELEHSENEFTDRARRLKIRTLAQQGDFTRKIEELKTFESCYLRAQFEAFQLTQDPAEELRAQLKRLPDPATITDPKEKKKIESERARIEAEFGKLTSAGPAEQEKKRKAHIDNILKALNRALALPEVKKMKPSLELDNARAMTAYWSLNTGKLEDAIKYGESFAREAPRASQASMSAVYAVQAYQQLLAKKDRYDEDASDLRARMLSLSHYMEDRWPGEMAGEMGAHTLALQMLREENYREAIKKLSLITPGYGNFTLARYQLADAALKAERDKVEPIEGDRPGDYRKRALLALESMPASALGPDPFTNQLHVAGKAILGRELFKYKRYQHMDDLASGLLDQLGKLKFNDDNEKDRTIRDQLRFELVDIRLYARYGLADAALQAGDFAKAAGLIDPLIDQVNKEDDSQEKTNLQKNPQLATLFLTTALKANLQLGKIDRTEAVLETLNKVTANGDSASTINVMRLLAFLIRGQIDDLRRKGDKDELNKAIKGYSAILDKQISKVKGEMKPDFIRVLADCYSSMGEHAKAASELAKIPDPRAKPNTDEDRMYKGVQLLHMRELRLSGTKENIKKARELMDKIRGDKKPGWGRTVAPALIEHGLLLEAEEKWAEAFPVWADLVKRLAKDVQKGGPVRDWFLESSFHTISCGLKIAQSKRTGTERDNEIRRVAQQIVTFERSWEDFGSEASKKRFTELLAAEPALRQQYEALKKKK